METSINKLAWWEEMDPDWHLEHPRKKEEPVAIERPLTMAELDALTKEEDKAFFEQILKKDVPFFHYLYAKYQTPVWLEITELLEKCKDKLKKRHAN